MKEIVTFNQLATGALLKFGRIDSTDMTLLMNDINKVVDLVHNEKDYMNNYFILVDGSILFNDSYMSQFYQIKETSILDEMQGSCVKEYMSNLNILEFVLRKIRVLGLGNVVADSMEETFSDVQMKAVNELYQKGFIENYLHENIIYGNYEAG